jgi:16S rRNA (uracil1498-N3)-methyltransferase
MHRHFVTPAQLNAAVLTLTHAEAHHLRNVLRVRLDETVELCDGAGGTVLCRIAQLGRQGLTLEQLAPPMRRPPPACRLTLCACVCKRLDWTIEKAVELGAARIVPALSARAVIRLDDAQDREAKRARWERVALDAARQCAATRLPEIVAPLPLPQALERHLAGCRPLLVAALVTAARPLRAVLASWRAAPLPTEAALAIGPEGDFTAAELETLRAAGGVFVSLGRHVLRAETAALYGLSLLNAEWLA